MVSFIETRPGYRMAAETARNALEASARNNKADVGMCASQVDDAIPCELIL